MKPKRYYFKATTTIIAMLLLSACETGMKNKKVEEIEAPSGIVDKVDNHYASTSDTLYSSSSSIKKSATHRIFSNSATPGYYVQVGFFRNNKPNATFMRRIGQTALPYTILLKNGNHYALIGPYKSLNQAKNKISSIKSTLARKPFVIEVLRP